jgi:hypothetical protein
MSNIGNKRIGAPKLGSFEEYFGPWGEITRTDTFVCNHCTHVIAVPKGDLEKKQRCFACDGLVCQTCKRENKVCFPAEALMELQEKIGRKVGAAAPDTQRWRDIEVGNILRAAGIWR